MSPPKITESGHCDDPELKKSAEQGADAMTDKKCKWQGCCSGWKSYKCKGQKFVPWRDAEQDFCLLSYSEIHFQKKSIDFERELAAYKAAIPAKIKGHPLDSDWDFERGWDACIDAIKRHIGGSEKEET